MARNWTAPLFGALGIVIAASLTGPLTLGLLLQGFSLGYSIGAFLFPDEIDIEDDPVEFDVPTAEEGVVVPVTFGKAQVQPHVTYYDPENVRTLRTGEQDQFKYRFLPMELAVCMSDNATVHRSGSSGPYLDQDEAHRTLGVNPIYPPRVRLLDSEGNGLEFFLYFLAGVSWYLHSWFTNNETMDDVRTDIERWNARIGDDRYQNGYDRYVTLDHFYKSFPQESWGLRPRDFFTEFTDPDWPPYIPSSWRDPNPVTMFWPDDMPDHRGVLSLASPVWPLEMNATGLGNFKIQVEDVYPSDCGEAYILALTHPVWGHGLAESQINLNTFRKNGMAAHVRVEGLSFNGALTTARKTKSVLESFNAHLNAIVRKDHLGRLEFLPLRSISEYSYTEQNYEDWLAAGADEDTDFTYIPGFPVLFDVYDEDLDQDFSVSNQGWDTTVNRVIVSHPNEENNYKQTPFPIFNRASRLIAGFDISKDLSYPLFNNIKQATIRGQLYLKSKSRPNAVLEMELPIRYHRIREGDGLRVFSSEHDMQGVIFRITEREDARLGSTQFRVRGVLDVLSLQADKFASFWNDIPDQDNEPDIPDDPDDPGGMQCITSHWQHNLSTADGMFHKFNRNDELHSDVDDYTGSAWTVHADITIEDPLWEGPDHVLASARAVRNDNAISNPSAYVYQDYSGGAGMYTAWWVLRNHPGDANNHFAVESRVTCWRAGDGASAKTTADVVWATKDVQSVSVGPRGKVRYLWLDDDHVYVECSVWTDGVYDVRAELQPGVNGVYDSESCILHSQGLVRGDTAIHRFLSEVYVAQGQAGHIGYRHTLDRGPLNPHAGVQIAEFAKGNVPGTTFAHKFGLLEAMAADEHRYVLPASEDGMPLFVIKDAHSVEDITDKAWFGVDRTVNDSESSDLVAFLVGRPTNPGGFQFDDDVNPTVEVLRFDRIDYGQRTRVNLLHTDNEDWTTWARSTGASTPAVDPTTSPVPGADVYKIGTKLVGGQTCEYGAQLFTYGVVFVPGEGTYVCASMLVKDFSADDFTVGFRDADAVQDASVKFLVGGTGVVSVDTATNAEGYVIDRTDIEAGFYEVGMVFKGDPDILLVEGNRAKMFVQVQDDDTVNKHILAVAPMLEHGTNRRTPWTSKYVHGTEPIYRLHGVQRSINKEYPHHWPPGSELWIVDMAQVQLPDGVKYEDWGQRSFALDKTKASGDEGFWRVRGYVQSVIDFGDGDGQGSEQPETEGLSRTFDEVNSQYFAQDVYLDSNMPPAGASQVWRVGTTRRQPLWYDARPDRANDFLNNGRIMAGLSTFGTSIITDVAAPSAWSKDNQATLFEDTDATNPSDMYDTLLEANLTDLRDYTVYVLARPDDFDNLPQARSRIKIAQEGVSNESYVEYVWSTGSTTGSSGTWTATPFGYDGWVLFTATIPYDKALGGSKNIIVRFFPSTTGSWTGKMRFDTPFVYEGTKPADLPDDGEWVGLFSPFNTNSGIGEGCTSAARTNCQPDWPLWTVDAHFHSAATLFPEAPGDYKLIVQAMVDNGDADPNGWFDYDAIDTVELSVPNSGDWPMFVWAPPAEVLDNPTASDEYCTTQLLFSLSKRGDGAGTYGPPTRSETIGPWPNSMDVA